MAGRTLCRFASLSLSLSLSLSPWFSSFSLGCSSRSLLESRRWAGRSGRSGDHQPPGYYSGKPYCRRDQESSCSKLRQQQQQHCSMDIILQAAGVVMGALLASQMYLSRLRRAQQPLPRSATLADATIALLQQQHRQSSTAAASASDSRAAAPFYGSLPHYFMPPSDLEVYRKRRNPRPHPTIPLPSDKPSTFPAAKVRKAFTKEPKLFREIVLLRNPASTSGDSALSGTQKSRLMAAENRFRAVYGGAEEQGLDIVLDWRDPGGGFGPSTSLAES